MEKDDELWLKKMREMLIQYDEPAPPHGWEKLQKELRSPINRRIIPKRFWAAAAAVFLLAVSGVSFYFLHSPVADDIRLTSTPPVNVVPDVIPSVPVLENQTSRIEPVERIGKSPKSLTGLVAKATQGEVTVTNVEKAPETDTPDFKDDGQPTITNQKQETTTNKQPVKEEPDNNRKMARPSGKDKLHLPIEEPTSSNRKNWSVGLSVNSGGGATVDNNGSTSTYPRGITMNNFASIANSSGADFVDVSNNELKFQNGLPYLQAGYTLDHKLPVTFGLSVRKGITSSISLETGLTYTYLSSDIHNQGENGSKVGEQKLHYIGLPLKVNWSFVNTDRFNIYVSGGGAIEKCVYGKVVTDATTESNTVKPLQFSLAGGVGAQYNITRKLGIYAEPGVAYYFDDGSKTQTIRKEKKFNLNLQAGIRLTY